MRNRPIPLFLLATLSVIFPRSHSFRIVSHRNGPIVSTGHVPYQPLVESPCPVGTDGHMCATDHVPSCRTPDGSLIPPYSPTTCTCVQEWRRFAYPFHFGTNSFAGNAGHGVACFNVSKEDSCLFEALKNPKRPEINCAQAFFTANGTLEEIKDPGRRLVAAAPRLCALSNDGSASSNGGGDLSNDGGASSNDESALNNDESALSNDGSSGMNGGFDLNGTSVNESVAVCGGHGFCAYSWEGTAKGATDKAECRCWKGRYGSQCDIVRGKGMVSPRGDGSKCLNNCAGHGECRHATCACDVAYGGIDCSTTLDPASVRLVNTHTGTHAGELHPRFFVLDLPARFTTHPVFYSRLRWDQVHLSSIADRLSA